MRRGSQPSAKALGAAEGKTVVEVVGEGVDENGFGAGFGGGPIGLHHSGVGTPVVGTPG
jgi:hypothetical protein